MRGKTDVQAVVWIRRPDGENDAIASEAVAFAHMKKPWNIVEFLVLALVEIGLLILTFLWWA